MTVKELIGTLKYQTNIELLENDKFLYNTISDSKVLDVYGEREVINWYSHKHMGDYKAVITVNIKGESE